MENYEQKFKIGTIVKGVRTFNGEIIEGKFNGFHLYNKLNPKSVVGVIDTGERFYDVFVDSIEFVESEDEKIRKALIQHIKDKVSVISGWRKEELISWLEKQGEHKCDCKYVGCHVNNMKRWCHKKQSEISYEKCNTECPEYLNDSEQKPAEWSEEDKYKLGFLTDMLEGLDSKDFDLNYMKELSNWLKSLKPNHWKPSEEQMDELSRVTRGNSYPYLSSLYKDLKKL